MTKQILNHLNVQKMLKLNAGLKQYTEEFNL